MKKLLILTVSVTILVLCYTNEKVYAATEESVTGINTVLDRLNPIEIKSVLTIEFLWCTARVNLRKEASLESDIIITLDKRTKVEARKTSSKGWTEVKYEGKVGYVYSYYLTDEKFVPLDFTKKEIELLQRITEAEVTNCSYESKMNVASVIINRILNKEFPDDIRSVIFQNSQFSPVDDGRFYEVTITDETIKAVKEVLEKGSVHNGLYFCSMKDVKNLSNKEWFKKLEYLFTDDSGQSYYK